MIAGCLEKDPARRRQRVQNAVIELKLAGRSPSHTAEPPRQASVASGCPGPGPDDRRCSRHSGHWASQRDFRLQLQPASRRDPGGILALAASSVAAVLFLQQKPVPMVLKFAVSQPENTSYPGMPSVLPMAALSPSRR